MPGRNQIGDYRYGYQGEFAETDPETGKPAFELRLYDPRINRWLTVDPYGEYDSPYLAMGNNWISNVDPDGGCVKCDPNAAVGATATDAGGNGVTMTDTGWVRDDGYEANLGTIHTVKLEGYLGQARFLMRPEDTMGDFWDRKADAERRIEVGNKSWLWGAMNVLTLGNAPTMPARNTPRQFKGSNIAPAVQKNTITSQRANHIFSDKSGKFIDTPTNRDIITRLSNNKNHLMGIDQYGVSWYAKKGVEGSQVFSAVNRQGQIIGAGINQTPRSFTYERGLRMLGGGN